MSTQVEHHQPRKIHSTDQSLGVTRRVRTPSPRRGAIRRGSVTFDHQTSIFPEKGEGEEEQGLLKGSDEETEQNVERGSCFGCHFLVDNKIARRLFRVSAVINLISLAFSAPLPSCNPNNEENNCDRVFIQFVVITVLDLLLALLYSVQTYVRFQYGLYEHWRRRKLHGNDVDARSDVDTAQRKDLRDYTSPVRLLILLSTTLSLWYSVGIGVYRTYNHYIQVEMNQVPSIGWYLYLPFIIRSLAVVTAMKLFVHLRIPPEAVQGLIKNIKWKQLMYVTAFYFFFVYIYALIGVQWIGGLPNTCVSNQDISTLAVPVTHCNNISSDEGSCFADDTMTCALAPNGSAPLMINYRDRVYLGQFRTIVDALFAVYEASSLELWFFMEQAAQSGASRSAGYIALFYYTLVILLVILFQQSIFLVVIIESFADLRDDSALNLSKKDKKKPVIVLEHSENDLRLKYLKNHESITAFEKALSKYYFNQIEKVFLVIVLVDAVFTASKHTNMCGELTTALRIWQPAVSAVFLIEIFGVLAVHIFYGPSQFRLFYSSGYYWYLLVVAVCSTIASIPVSPLYVPNKVSSGFAIFQALRLPRAIRLVPPLKRFCLKIFGSGLKLLVVFLIVVVFLIWFAIVSMQIFGYLDTEEGCSRFGNDQFGHIFKALESMFLLVMQEGWTGLVGEIMCHRDNVWWLINIYFIVLHLLGSLVLLNFFAAVILDNLDYDDEKKKEKFEKELKERKVEKVSWKLKIFQCCGPKRIRVPKLSSADTPELIEADVRNFYSVGDSSNIPVAFDLPEQPLVTASQQSQTSELSGLDLLTERNETPSIVSHENKYWRVQGILNYVKAFRQHNRDTEATARPSVDILKGRTDNQGGFGIPGSSKVRSEYDDYREKYRLFDSALFCMPPDHWIRKFCNKVLTTQMEVPSISHISDSREIKVILTSRIKFVCQYAVSLFPYFTWLMLIVTVVTIGVQVAELFVSIQRINPTYIWLSDIIFILATLMELCLKILAKGFFFNPNAAISSLWDVLDWIILAATFAVAVVYIVHCQDSTDLLRTDITLIGLSYWFQALLFFRQIRPLRLISLIPSMRQVLYDVILGWRKFLQGLILLAGFIFLFASLGVQLFAGEDSPQSFCNDPSVVSVEECFGEFSINIELSPQELLPVSEIDVSIKVPRVWYRSRRDFKFDSTPLAFLTLFEVLTLEGWLDVRDVFSQLGQTDRFNLYLSIYLHIFVFLGVNLGLQLFVGIVVNNFNEHKPDHSALLTVSQKRWQDLTQRISLTRPIKRPPEPRNNKIRLILYKSFVSPYYKHFSSAIITFNSFLLCLPWDGRFPELEVVNVYLIGFFIAFAVFYIVEFVLKFIAFGLSYFQSLRNIFDCLLSIVALIYIILAVVCLSGNMHHIIFHVADTALLLTVLKLITILMKYSTFQNLLSTVINTLVKASSLFGVLLCIILTYAFVGNLFFANVRSGEAVDYGLVNFNGVFVSANIVFRVMTGEDWHQLLTDAMVRWPYCSERHAECGSVPIAIIGFISYYVAVTFILINVVVAVLLENFSIFYNEDDTELSHGVVKDFKQNWLYFDKKATGTIKNNRVKLFLRTLKLQEFFTYRINENGVKERTKCLALNDPLMLREIAEELRRDPRQLGGKPEQTLSQQQFSSSFETNREAHSFQDVLKAMAYRAEDITKRLVPHELYVREEVEESVQFDVAENCILKWMQCFVKPVAKCQARHRRQTMSQSVLRRTPNLGLREDSVMWDASNGEWNDHYVSAPETEDDGDLVTNGQLQPFQQHANLEEKLTTPALVKSYAKLEKAIPKMEGKDKWHDWFQMQADWMENVENNPDHYFDDGL